MPDKLIVSTSPHILGCDLTPKVMWSVIGALIPAAIASVIIFGMPSVKIMAVAVFTCVACEALIQKLTGRAVTIHDGSAALTGLLLAFNLSSNVPFWIPLVGGIFAIALVKHAFGGLGANVFNPALAARAFLLASWPTHMTAFTRPFAADAVTSATPLMMFKEGKVGTLVEMGISYWDLFLGRRGGCLGEVCIIALVCGAAYLLWKRYIWWQTPFSFILTTGSLCWIFGARGYFQGDFLFSILSGGLILGAFFMATDYVTTPLAHTGQVFFGVGCGVLTFLIRKFGGYPEGVSYSILIMNAFVPLIDRYVKPKIYGTAKAVKG
ncbi:MAG: RnfABCDGE type electron transport complex subunit D [Candidatus Omnitrophica bacterium]|nr:RnfABCDGE type electron transport complex subunit D [Candidatus Omnitrophota bacterium]